MILELSPSALCGLASVGETLSSMGMALCLLGAGQEQAQSNQPFRDRSLANDRIEGFIHGISMFRSDNNPNPGGKLLISNTWICHLD